MTSTRSLPGSRARRPARAGPHRPRPRPHSREVPPPPPTTPRIEAFRFCGAPDHFRLTDPLNDSVLRSTRVLHVQRSAAGDLAPCGRGTRSQCSVATLSRATNTETDNPETGSSSRTGRSTISAGCSWRRTLMRRSACTRRSATLRATAKPFYDILGHKFPSPDRTLIVGPWTAQQSSSSGQAQSSSSVATSCSVGGSVHSYQCHDVGHSEQLQAHRGLCGRSSQPLVVPSSAVSDAADSLEDPLITNGRIPEYLFESLPTWDFRRGVEEAQKFLPGGHKLVIDLEAAGVSKPQEAVKDIPFNVSKTEVLKAKKNRQSEDLDLIEGRNIKQSAFCSDEPDDWVEMFDDLFRQTEKKATVLREKMRSEASKNSQVIQTKGTTGVKTRGRKPTKMMWWTLGPSSSTVPEQWRLMTELLMSC
ncbi:hypothetical protein ZWY2020_040126 [Hordeum vulgare]|nr:hypothetical protein ZWY2020_040126 [Hordeum vulgare]